MFYRRQRIYVNKDNKRSTNFIDVCPKKLTLRKNLHPKAFLTHITDGCYHTAFNEIDVLHFNQAYPEEIYEFGTKPIERAQVSRKEFATIMFDQIKRVIQQTWDSNKFHVIPCSSGYDSRLILYILKSLNLLKNYIVFESHGEYANALKIFRILDEKNFIFTYTPRVAENAHGYCFGFKSAWKGANGYTGYPLNSWYWPVKWLQVYGLAPSDSGIQCYTGYGANETNTVMFHRQKCANKNGFAWGNRMGMYFAWHYLHQLSGFALKGEWVHPFYNLEFLEKFVKYSYGHIEHLRPGFSMSSIILEEIYPELASIHKMVTKEVKALGYFNVSRETLDRAVSDYKKSWYGKKYPISATSAIKYCNWWGSWQLASLCSHLLERGHEIT